MIFCPVDSDYAPRAFVVRTTEPPLGQHTVQGKRIRK